MKSILKLFLCCLSQVIVFSLLGQENLQKLRIEAEKGNAGAGKNAAVQGETYHPICKKRQYSNLHDHPKGRKIIQLPNEMGGRSMNNKQLPGEKYGM